MKIRVNRIYKEEKNNAPLITVKKVIETSNIASYEESYVFEGLVEVTMYTGEMFIVAESFKEFDDKITKADLEDEERRKREDLF
jgi:hypothetical protein